MSEPSIKREKFTNRRVNELWTLTQTGNFDATQCDLDGNGTIAAAAGDIDDDRTHNAVNEIEDWQPGGSSGTKYNVTHDAAGNMTDDGRDYKFTYDPFGRLVTVKNQSSAVVSEYRYNGLGYRIGWHYDTDSSNTVDGSDPWYYLTYDERWRVVATPCPYHLYTSPNRLQQNS